MISSAGGSPLDFFLSFSFSRTALAMFFLFSSSILFSMADLMYSLQLMSISRIFFFRSSGILMVMIAIHVLFVIHAYMFF